jgi:anti-anti-sigma regulatory factor
MLRITNSHTDGPAATLKLEGKLLEPWVGELQDSCQRTATAMPSLTLDLTGLTFVDGAGTVALRELRRHGIRLTGCSPLVIELLKETQS